MADEEYLGDTWDIYVSPVEIKLSSSASSVIRRGANWGVQFYQPIRVLDKNFSKNSGGDLEWKHSAVQASTHPDWSYLSRIATSDNGWVSDAQSGLVLDANGLITLIGENWKPFRFRVKPLPRNSSGEPDSVGFRVEVTHSDPQENNGRVTQGPKALFEATDWTWLRDDLEKRQKDGVFPHKLKPPSAFGELLLHVHICKVAAPKPRSAARSTAENKQPLRMTADDDRMPQCCLNTLRMMQQITEHFKKAHGALQGLHVAAVFDEWADPGWLGALAKRRIAAAVVELLNKSFVEPLAQAQYVHAGHLAEEAEKLARKFLRYQVGGLALEHSAVISHTEDEDANRQLHDTWERLADKFLVKELDAAEED